MSSRPGQLAMDHAKRLVKRLYPDLPVHIAKQGRVQTNRGVWINIGEDLWGCFDIGVWPLTFIQVKSDESHASKARKLITEKLVSPIVSMRSDARPHLLVWCSRVKENRRREMVEWRWDWTERVWKRSLVEKSAELASLANP